MNLMLSLGRKFYFAGIAAWLAAIPCPMFSDMLTNRESGQRVFETAELDHWLPGDFDISAHELDVFRSEDFTGIRPAALHGLYGLSWRSTEKWGGIQFGVPEWNLNRGKGRNPTRATGEVPEGGATVAMLGCSLVVLAALRRRMVG